MASDRIGELKASLLRELEIITKRENLAPIARLKWLRGELENYVERWLGFAVTDEVPYPSTLRGDLFTMVIVATEIFEDEISRGKELSGKVEWSIYKTALARVRSAKDRSQLSRLRESLAAVGVALDV